VRYLNIFLVYLIAITAFAQEKSLNFSFQNGTWVLKPNTNLAVFDLLISTNLPPSSNQWERVCRLYNLDHRPLDIEIPNISANPPVFFKVEKAIYKYPERCLGFPDFESQIVAYFSPFGIRYRWKDTDTNYFSLVVETACASNSICFIPEFVHYTNRYAIRSYINFTNCSSEIFGIEYMSPPVGLDARLKTTF
jgi:hypothetical protein